MDSPFDVLVIGGGPAGSGTATRLAQLGRRVLVLERDVFPRFHIGESQLPWSTDIFETLGVAQTIADAGFVPKWGATFLTADGEREQYADFMGAPQTPRPQTYQVSRAEFDHILLTHAQRSGATIVQSAQVRDVRFTPDAVEVSYTTDRRDHDARAAVVVDASGRAGFLARRLGVRRYDRILRNVAIHAQYEGIPRREGRRAGDIRMVMRPDCGWFWFIPLSATVTSVGVVMPKRSYTVEADAALEDRLERFLREIPAADALTRDSRLVSPARFDADYSYDSETFAGDRWVAVGDAGSFLDPIFSTGVFLALQGAVEAAHAIDTGLRRGKVSRACFKAYEGTVRRRYQHFRRFAIGFYDPPFRDLFFAPSAPFGVREAVISTLAGNWRPSLPTRLRIALFFALVEVQRRMPIVPRLADIPSGAYSAADI